MRLFKVFLIILVPILCFVAIWRLINLGDSYSYKGIKWFTEYFQSFPGWQHTFECFSKATSYFTFSWGEVLASVLAPAYLIAKIVFALGYFLVSLFIDIVQINTWIFGWLTNMLAS